MFLSLTTIYKNKTGPIEAPIWLNTEHVVYMRPNEDGTTYIQTVNIMPDDCWFTVKESVQQILSAIPC